ncbi:hypothetical protein GCM10011386_12870 [Parapedobacter defluvii]|uniref:Uncharacterized protein n=1 Tax=Parapedobacter defluvii TaxID=2045106 RepID=A0ABQ1LF33_9SPHI|nr:hypothetical protein GCM10011386_12870 [Parapedobacter defluvii]
MKKYLTSIAIVASTSIGLNVNLKFDGGKAGMMGVTLNNIEALASGEDSDTKCFLLGSVDCPHSAIKVLYIR